MSNTITVTVYRVTRLNDSVYGNPNYEFSTSAGNYRTRANTSAAYRLTEDFREDESINDGNGVQVTFTLTRAGRVIDWEVI